jgi:hypothetical protein
MADAIFLDSSNCECDVTLDTWLRDTLPVLPGAVREVASRELVLAAREFFERSFTWQAEISNVNAKAGDKQYWLSPYDQYSNVIGILGVRFNGNDLTPYNVRPRSTDSSTDTPTHFYTQNAPDSLYLYPTLATDQDDVLDIFVALTPKQSVEHLPRIAAIKFYDAIREGFLARMLMHPNKPYSQPAVAQLHRRNFMSQIGRYMGQAKQGYVQAQAWQYPQGWQVRRSQRR